MDILNRIRHQILAVGSGLDVVTRSEISEDYLRAVVVRAIRDLVSLRQRGLVRNSNPLWVNDIIEDVQDRIEGATPEEIIAIVREYHEEYRVELGEFDFEP